MGLSSIVTFCNGLIRRNQPLLPRPYTMTRILQSASLKSCDDAFTVCCGQVEL